MTDEELLLANKVAEYGDVIFIKPHAQFPSCDERGYPSWTDSMTGYYPGDISRSIELYGRVCYKSEDRITEGSSEKFVKMLIKSGHESVLEHVSLTAKFVGSRAMSHQQVRHRLNAFSQESQRYCNYGKSEKLYAIMPPSFEGVADDYMSLVNAEYGMYKRCVNTGIKAEDARYLLPNATKTEVVMSCNIRQWRHVFQERALNSHAQWEIKMIANKVLQEFNRVMPELFGDLIK